MVFFYFVITAFFYFFLNRPFLGMACHHDSGWHSYWAAFRKRGADLSAQLNTLLGCARLGSMYYFVLLFKLFGPSDPEKLSRKVFFLLNYIAHIAIFLALKLLFPGNWWLISLGSLLYLFLTSNPFYWIHYESSERTVLLINVFLFLLISLALSFNLYYLFVPVVGLMFLSMFFFKITQVIEYCFVWLFMVMISNNPLIFIFQSFLGFCLALIIFIGFLHYRGLLKRSLFVGLGRYAKMANNLFSPGFKNKSIHELVINYLGDSFYSKVVIKLLILIRGCLSERLFLQTLCFIKSIVRFSFLILRSSKFFIVSSFFGYFLNPSGLVENLFFLWFLGAFLSVFIQGKYISLHYIPLILPLSLLSSLGIFHLFNVPFLPYIKLLIGLLFFLLFCSDFKTWRKCFFAKNGLVEEVFWPRDIRAMLYQNRLVYQLKDYIGEKTCSDDYIFVWGCVPQTYVICDRPSPVDWLSSLGSHIGSIIENWEQVTFEKVKTKKPVYIIDFIGNLSEVALKQKSRLNYKYEKTFSDICSLYRLSV